MANIYIFFCKLGWSYDHLGLKVEPPLTMVNFFLIKVHGFLQKIKIKNKLCTLNLNMFQLPRVL